MSAAGITGDGRAAIEKSLKLGNDLPLLQDLKGEDSQLSEIFQIEDCLSWIKENGFKRVCLQFPDEYLVFSRRICGQLEAEAGCRCYILADSTYGSCCVDEKTAHHVPDTEAIIHFGQSCLSPCSGKYKVLYVFTRPFLDLEKLERVFRAEFDQSDKDSKIVIAFDVIYEHAAGLLFNQIQSDYPSVSITSLVLPGTHISVEDKARGLIKHSRRFPFEEKDKITVFYIGSRALPNILLALPTSTFKVYDPIVQTESVSTQTSLIDKLIRKRNFYIEKIKDATSIGILVGTLVVQNYLDVIERLKRIFRQVQKRFYVVSIGEINTCKLANFMDIDCFVFVGCPEVVNYYISDESKGQFFQPIVTPYDVELAFCEEDNLTPAGGQKYCIDWAYLVEKGEPKVKEVLDDVSLISGGMRTTTLQDWGDNKKSANQVVNWIGLDLNEESPSLESGQIHQGRSGIASSYADEPITN